MPPFLLMNQNSISMGFLYLSFVPVVYFVVKLELLEVLVLS